MAPQYTVSVYTSAGVLQAISQDFLVLKISRVVNAPDICMLAYNLDTSAYTASFLQIDNLITVTRWDTEAGISSTIEFSGVIRRTVRTYDEKNSLEVLCYSMMDVLNQRIIAYQAGRNNRSRFTAVPAETIIKTLFNFNIGSSATTANGRALDGRITGMTTSASAGTGTVLSLDCAYSNLLSTMQDVAEDGGGDFSITYTAPASWVLTWHLGQLGTDRSATVTLSVPMGTIGELVIDNDKTNDFNAVVVGGTGEGTARLIATRPATLPTGIALKERFVDARSQKRAGVPYLQALGNRALARMRKRRIYSAKILQNAALKYGRDYFIGDLVTILNAASGVSVIQKVAGVELSFEESGQENIDVQLAPNS